MKAQVHALTAKKSGPISGPISEGANFPPSPKERRIYPKTDARYLRTRVFHHSRPGKNSEKVEDDSYSVRIAFRGRRERFTTCERTKETAASVAAEIYRTLGPGGIRGCA